MNEQYVCVRDCRRFSIAALLLPVSLLQSILLYGVFYLKLSQLIVNAGGVAAMVDYVSETCGNVRLPGIMMLGYVAAHSENLAMAVIVSKVSWFVL